MTEERRFLYSAYVLTEDSKQKLVNWLCNNGVYTYQNRYLRHCTIQFGEDSLSETWVGELVKLSITHFVFNEMAMAFRVGNAELSCKKDPHITISTIDGIPPVYSDTLLSGGIGEEKGVDIEVETIISKIYSK